jgi:tellurite resistance protein
MKVRVEVAALAAAVDGAGTEEEMQAIIGTIRSDAELPQLERLRLIAYAVTVFKSPPKRERIMRRLADTNESERKSIAAAAVAVVGQRDQADPREVKFLEKLHKALKLPAGQVYSDIHRAAVTIDEPIPVSVEKRIPGIKIPKDQAAEATAPRQPASGIRIVRKKLADVQRDTKAVSEILSRIFVDAPQAEEPNPVAAAAVPSAFNGLDAGHAELVKFLEKKGAVARPEFESRAKALRLLPAGAIERINDWSFDRFDEPLLEDGENIVLSPHLRDRLAELREMST